MRRCCCRALSRVKRKSGRYGDAVVLLGDGHALPHIDIHFGHVLLEARDESGVLRDLDDECLVSFICGEGLDTLCDLQFTRRRHTDHIRLFVDSLLILC